MKTYMIDKSTGAKKAAAKAEVTRWWALAGTGNGGDETVAVRLRDDRQGFLKISLDRAFDGSDDWCELDVIGEGGPVRYTASQIGLPLGLRRHIACKALSSSARYLAYTLDKEMIAEVPQYGTYLAAKYLEAGEINNGNLQEFSELIAEPDAVGCTEEEEIQNMQRLVLECRKYLPSGNNAAIPQETYGVGIE